MDARPSPEQQELAEAADRLAKKLGPSTVGDLDDIDRRARLEAALAQTGWRDLRCGSPSDPLASGVEAAIVARALAQRACDTSFLGPVLAHDLIRRAGGTGEGPAYTVAMSCDLHSPTCVSASTAAGAAVAIDAATSSHAILLVEHDAGCALASVPLDDPIEGVDLTRPVARITELAPAMLIDGLRLLDADDIARWICLGVALTAADLVGAMEGALELATEYAKERRQFGSAIGSYQAVQHLLAEGKTMLEGAASAMVHAAWAADALPTDQARQAAAVAKAYASRAARVVCETSIQVHGGIGNTWECMAHVFLRRTLLSTELFGGEGTQLELLARQRWGATYGLS